MPAEMHDELLALQALSVEQLQCSAVGQVSPSQQARHVELLDKNSTGVITPAEQDELAGLRLSADRLMLHKAYAWAVLRWRGYAVPPVSELPLG